MKHLLALQVLLWTLSHAQPDSFCSATNFKLDGEYIVGGLFDIHHADPSDYYGTLVTADCSLKTLTMESFRMFQMMRFAVHEINNSSLILPNVSLGYEIFDYCSYIFNFPTVLEMMSRNESIEVLRSFNDYVPKVIAVAGPVGSTESMTVAPLFAMDSIPMVNFAASSSVLSEKKKYPTFMRTTPSNKEIIHLIIQIIKHFKWDWIAFVGSNNEYSQNGLSLFQSELKDTSICLAYVVNLNENSNHSEILHTLDNLNIKVIIVYTVPLYVVPFIKSAIKYNIQKVWIASETWSLNKELPRLNADLSIGTVIGVTETVVPLPGFYNFVNVSQAQRNERQKTCKKTAYGQTCNQEDVRTNATTEDVININPSYSFAIYSAIYTIAHALHRVLQCDVEGCGDNVTVYPYMVLQELKRSNFTLFDRPISFDQNGDPTSSSYSIVFWNQSGMSQKVGYYVTDPTLKARFFINETLIRWHDNEVPFARCSDECSEGYTRRKEGFHVCCFRCELCPSMTYVNNTSSYNCSNCKETEWSKPGSTHCKQRSVEYIPFTDPFAITLVLSTVILLALTLAICILFAYNYDKPVVKSAGGPMCFLLLGCLSTSSISVFFFFDKPTYMKCVFRYFPFMLLYNVCLACFAVRSFQIVCIFKIAAKFPEIHRWWVKVNGQWLVILISFVFYLSLLITIFTTSPPTPVNDMVSYEDQIILKCAMKDVLSMFLSVTLIMSGLCFIFSYMGKDLPKNYNEAKAITLFLLFLVLTWIGFCTACILYHGKYIELINAMSVISSEYSILVCYFLPKCYIIIFQPHKNTQKYFQGIIQSYTQNISSQ